VLSFAPEDHNERFLRIYQLKHSENWHLWWQGVLGVDELKPGDANGVGSIRRSRWKSALPYTLEFDMEVMRVEEPHVIEVRAFGELEGTGLWTLTADDASHTSVRYDWKVNTNKSWMNMLAPIARPFFQWNHDVIMEWGGKGLAKRLGCKLLNGRERKIFLPPTYKGAPGN
jgi:hypothetical protein